MIRFRCPHCKKPLSVKDHLAGKKAACPVCKKPLLIPTAAAAKPATTKPTAGKPTASKPAATKPPEPTPPPEAPPIDADAVAAAALADEPQTNGKQAAPSATIDFTCEFCDTELHVPRADAGKRMQCPNPECRGLIKVPSPKDGQPKALPTVAQLQQQVEKIDEAAWGTQTDKGRVTRESLEEAGAVAAPKAPPIGPRGWIRRGMWTIAVVAVLVVTVIAASRIKRNTEEKDFVRQALKYVEQSKGGNTEDLLKEPALRAEVYQTIALYKARHGKKNSELLDTMQKALACVRGQAADKGPAAIDQDLFLIELALTATELGGTEDEEREKLKYTWKNEILRGLFQSILSTIKSPEVKVMAMRALATRLLEKEQGELAFGLASQLSNAESGRKPLVTNQLVALSLLNNKPVDKLVRAPKEGQIPEPLARVGFAEAAARKGNYSQAQDLAFKTDGPPAEQLEACVGVAELILGQKNGKAEEAAPFVDYALKIVNGPGRLPPWLVLQALRVGARVKGGASVAGLVKQLPADFQPRGYLEIVLAEADAARMPLDTTPLTDLRNAYPEAPAVELGWEALARQNARIGRGEVRDQADYENNPRYRAMVHIGSALGGLDRQK
jgi:hypothetical protein